MTVRTLVLGAAVFLAACSTVTGPAATPRWHLVEEARIGGKDEGPAGFADVRGIVVDARGQLWVLEAGSQEIRVFDSTGRHLRTLGRRGKGPGEFEYADGLTATPDGTVWVDDPTNSRMTGFSLDGAFAGQINAPTSGSGYVAAGGVDSLGRIWNAFITVNPKPTSDEDRSSRRFRRFTVDRTRADTVDQPQCGVRGDRIRSFIRGPGGAMTIPFFPAPISALDFNGRLICIPSSDRYEGFILALDQPDTLARFRRDMNPVAIPAVERDKEVKRLTEFATQIKAVGYSPSVVPTVRPAVEGIQIDDRGRLWIQRVTAASATEFDLFDQRGALVAVVECPFKPSTYFRPLFKGDRVWFIVAGEDDVPQVVRTRLVTQP